jgi:serine/threonine-protein kinase
VVRRLVRAIACLAFAALLGGCGRAAPSVEIARWTLVSPGDHGDAFGAPGTETSEIVLPLHIQDRLPKARARYSLRAHVALPPELRDRPLTFSIVDLPALATLYAGGREAGPLDVNTFDRYRSAGSHRWRIGREETHGDSLDLRLDVEHTWVQSAWLDAVPVLSATPAGEPWFVFMLGWNRATGILGLAMTLLVSTTFGLLYVFDRRRSVHGWHAAQGVFGSAYPCLSMGILQPIFGTGEVAVSAVLITLSAISSVYFVAGMFEQPRPKAWWWGFAAFVVGAALLKGDAFHASGLVVPGVVAAVLAATVNGLVVLSRARAHGKPPLLATLAALGFPITAAFGVPDMLALLGLGDPFAGLRGGSLALATVSLLQAAALSRSHVESLNRADDLNVELAGRVAALEATNREIRVLNDELRRQIGARSQTLEGALARIGPLSSARPRALAEGDVIEDRYRVVRCIGAGGMGTVYEVERLVDGKRLAFKVLQAARSGGELARLAREAQIASRLDHPNVVGIVDVDVSASGAVFIVMELVEGKSLDDLDARYGDATWALDLLRQIASGLAAMHAQGIVHRDLKPGNVLVTRARTSSSDVAKIADFGIAMRATESHDDDTTEPRHVLGEAATLRADDTARDEVDPLLTRTGQVLGTPMYMAPELGRGAKHASAASDVYALGVMAFELLTGHLPTGFEVLSHLRDRSLPLPSLASRIPSIDARLAELLDRCLAYEPIARPTASELEGALAAACAAPREAARGMPAA